MLDIPAWNCIKNFTNFCASSLWERFSIETSVPDGFSDWSGDGLSEALKVKTSNKTGFMKAFFHGCSRHLPC